MSDKEKSPETSELSGKEEANKSGEISNRSDNYIPKKRRESKDIKNYTVYSNKRVVSVFTYYPFF